MAESVTILDQDRADAENFLEQFLTDKIGADFRKGGALRDFAVGAIGCIFAFLRREVDYVKARQSLLLLGTLTGTDVDTAADEILSNWFITRKAGTSARGTVSIYLTSNDPFTVTTAMLFYRASGASYKPDYTSDHLFSEGDMSAVIDASGTVTYYVIRVPVVAVDAGETSDVEASAFTDYSPRSSRIARIENDSVLTDGQDAETTEAMISRSETAITTRNMASARSVDATLREEFPSLDTVVVVGYGDPEMIRDVILEEATGVRIHAGGYADAYMRSTIVEDVEYTATIGGMAEDPRPGWYIFRDDTIDFVAAGVAEGDVISVKNALVTEPYAYIAKQVSTYGLYVSRRSQFPLEMPEVEEAFTLGEVGPTISNWPIIVPGLTRLYAGTEYTFVATDVGKFIRVKNSTAGNDGVWEILAINDAPAHGTNYATLGGLVVPVFADETNVQWELCTRNVVYTIGNVPPGYNDKVGPLQSGRFTKEVQKDGRILLPFHPIYRIADVSFADPINATGYAVGGRVTFHHRVNVTPADPLLNPDNLQYQVIGNNPEESQSGWQLMEVNVGWAGAEALFNTYELRVTYDTISEYDDAWSFMTSADKRQVCAATIPRGLHPVYLSFEVFYKLSRTAVDTFDTAEAQQALADHLNAFSSMEELDTSDILGFLRTTYDILGYVSIDHIDYELIAPDGRVIPYQTTDVVELAVAKQTGLIPTDQLPDLLSQSISVNTVRYLIDPTDITFTEL